MRGIYFDGCATLLAPRIRLANTAIHRVAKFIQQVVNDLPDRL
jgi:hypothetical protein